MAETNDVFSSLKATEVEAKAEKHQLSAGKIEYTQQELDLFHLERLSVNGSNTSLRAEPKQRTHEQSKPIDSLGLLTLVAGQLGNSISLIEAGKILTACGLADNQQYTATECDRFIQACTLIKQQGKTYQEVAAHFGITVVEESGKRDALIEEVHALLSQVSATQANLIRTALPKMAVEQLQEVKSLFWRMTARRLRQYVDSGQLETEIRTASNSILATAGKHLGLLRSSSSPNLKSLAG